MKLFRQSSLVKWHRFFLKPASARPLAALRIGLAAILLCQAYWLRNSVFDFLSHDGLVQGDLARLLSARYAPTITGFVSVFSHFGIGEATTIQAVCFFYIASLIYLLLGFRPRTAALACWFLHWTLVNTASSTVYGVDSYAHVFLFYLIWMPSGDTWSLDSIRENAKQTSWQARLSLRVLQLHLCLSYLFSGIAKAQGPQWWNGEVLWRALSLPVYQQYDLSWLAWWPVLAKIAAWSTLVLELEYFIFIWPKSTRRIWILGIVGLHLGIAIFLGLGLFGAIMCLLTLAVFGVSPEAQPSPATELAITPTVGSTVESTFARLNT